MHDRKLKKIEERCIKTIETLCGLVQWPHYFYIGYSSVRACYVGSPGRVGWRHVVVLADKMKSKFALDVEEAIHNAINERKNILSKYHPKKKNKKGDKKGQIIPRRNKGRKVRGEVCSVY